MKVLAQTENMSLHDHLGGFAATNEKGKSRYSGKMNNTLRLFGWHSAASTLDQIQSSLEEAAKHKGRIKLTFNGIVGEHISVSKKLHHRIETTLAVSTDSHLAKDQSTTKTVFPGNQGQALARIIETEMMEYACQKAPFQTESELIAFINEQHEKAITALGNSEPTGDADESEDSEEEEMEHEEAGAEEEPAL